MGDQKCLLVAVYIGFCCISFLNFVFHCLSNCLDVLCSTILSPAKSVTFSASVMPMWQTLDSELP